MDAKLKADWVAALRSGEYRQTKHQLQDSGGFCCLGVLCKVAGIEITPDGKRTIVDGQEREDYGAIYSLVGGAQKGAKLPTKNDCGVDFPNIADWIEQNL